MFRDASKAKGIEPRLLIMTLIRSRTKCSQHLGYKRLMDNPVVISGLPISPASAQWFNNTLSRSAYWMPDSKLSELKLSCFNQNACDDESVPDHVRLRLQVKVRRIWAFFRGTATFDRSGRGLVGGSDRGLSGTSEWQLRAEQAAYKHERRDDCHQPLQPLRGNSGFRVSHLSLT